jgi:uncharacterized protein with von Willebrand factor type A (vWA) domain
VVNAVRCLELIDFIPAGPIDSWRKSAATSTRTWRSRTTGRTNFLDPKAQMLNIMREHCRRVIWLNPEPERLWGVGDSAIGSYSPFCDDVRSCQNLNELKTFITGLVL